MSVFVVGLNGCRLMPVSERKARLLLKGGKASVYRKVPFTIKLNYKTGSTVQPGYLGIDTGSQHIGLCGRTALEETEEHVHFQKTGRMAAAIPAVQNGPSYPVDPEAPGPSPGRIPAFHRTGPF